MNDLEMELQTIRQKLQTLKALPPEPVAAPWGQSQQTAPSPDLVQVTTAIEALRQRSVTPHALSPPRPSLEQFDDALIAVERLAEQQQQAWQQLQTIGNNLVQQTQPGVSPNVNEVARFLADCQPIRIPMVQRDRNGCLGIGHHVVDFRQAEHDASSNAARLRSRSRLFKHAVSSPHTQPLEFASKHYPKQTSQGLLDELKDFCQISQRAVTRWLRQQGSLARRSSSSQFTLLDSAIWFTGAAIVRLVLNQIFRIYPALWMPVAVILIAGIVVSLYSSIFSPRPNPTLGYRTLLIIVGLLIGGRFS